VDESSLNRGLDAWRSAIGAENVITDPHALDAAATATFATLQRLAAIVRPGDRDGVQAVVRAANEHRLPLYPVSRGRNWGLGSRVPCRDGCVLLDLGRMHRILDFSEKLAFITVEPGVTFAQVYEFLRERGSTLMAPVTGGPPDGSLIGNALERGDGAGPYGDRWLHACGLEVILPTGGCIHTGFGRFAGCRATPVSRHGVGPGLDGLFAQSNLGIVTAMTFWLLPRPAHIVQFVVRMHGRRELAAFLEAAGRLVLQSVLAPNCCSVWNGTKARAVTRPEVGGRRTEVGSEAEVGGRSSEVGPAIDDSSFPTSDLRPPSSVLRPPATGSAGFGDDDWLGGGAIFAHDRLLAEAQQRAIHAAFAPLVREIAFFEAPTGPGSPANAWLGEPTTSSLLSVYSKKGGKRKAEGGKQSMATRSPQSEIGGRRSEVGMESTSGSDPTSDLRPQTSGTDSRLDPDRDRCGVIWLCPELPLDAEVIVPAVEIIEQTARSATGGPAASATQPHIGVSCSSGRGVRMFVSLVYDRDEPGADERAMRCHDEMLQRLVRIGCFPYRLGIHSMDSLPPPADDSAALLHDLKRCLDPNDVLAPGRYDFRELWRGEGADRVE